MYIWTSQTAPASWTNEHETHESIMGMKEVHLQQMNSENPWIPTNFTIHDWSKNLPKC